MKRVALVAAAAAATVFAASALAATPPAQVMQFLDVQTSFTSTLAPNQAPKFGDQLAFTDAIYRWQGSKRGARVGRVDVTGVFIGNETLRITGIVHLPGGTLAVLGDAGNGRVTRIPIVGGTGAFAAARGEVVVRNLGGENSNNSAVTLRLWR